MIWLQLGILLCLVALIVISVKAITHSEPVEYEDDYGEWR